MTLLLFTAVLACYSATLDAGFVWDDHFTVVRNSLLRAPLFSFQPFFQDIVNSSFTHTIYYRPVQIMSYALDYRLWGMDAAGYHFVNILLHFMNALLVMALAYRITKSKGISSLAALLFAVHPVHAGAVSYISGRTDLLFFLFGALFMLANLEYRKGHDGKMLAAGGLFLALSLFSKEAAMIFPVLMVLADITVVRGPRSLKIKAGVVNFGVAGAYALGHYMLLGPRYPVLAAGSGSWAVSALKRAGEFIFLETVPSGVFLRRATGVMPAALISAAVIVVLMLILMVSLKRVRRTLLFAMSFLLVSLIPFISAAQAMGLVSEHWAYLSSFGAVLFFSAVIAEIYRRSAAFAKAIALSIALIAVTAYAFTTMRQNAYWMDDVSLSDRVLEVSPDDTTALNFKLASGIKAGAITGRAIDRDVRGREAGLSPRGHYLKGRRYLTLGEADKAREEFALAAEADPDYENAYLGMAMAEFMMGNVGGGKACLEKAREMNPLHPEVLLLRARIYGREDDLRLAITAASEAWARDPYGYDAMVDLGDAFLRAGGPQEAAKLYLEAAGFYPERAEPKYKLAEVLYMSGDAAAGKEARRWARRAVMTDPAYIPAQELLLKMAER